MQILLGAAAASPTLWPIVPRSWVPAILAPASRVSRHPLQLSAVVEVSKILTDIVPPCTATPTPAAAQCASRPHPPLSEDAEGYNTQINIVQQIMELGIPAAESAAFLPHLS